MNWLYAPAAGLAWLGRNGTGVVAVAVFVGLAVPPLAALVKPYLFETVIAMLTTAILRTDPAALRRTLDAPRLSIVATGWVMLAVPALAGVVLLLAGLKAWMPGLFLIVILHVAAPPITASPVFAAMVGLDVALSLVTLVAASAIAPLTTTAFSYIFLGSAVFSPLALGVKLFLIFGGSALLAVLIRRLAGRERLERHGSKLDGINVVALCIFAFAAMDGVSVRILANPAFALGVLTFTVALTFILVGLSALAFAASGIERSIAVGLVACNRNMGVIMAAVGAALPEVAWFYFGIAQIPIFLTPLVLRTLAGRFAARPAP